MSVSVTVNHLTYQMGESLDVMGYKRAALPLKSDFQQSPLALITLQPPNGKNKAPLLDEVGVLMSWLAGCLPNGRARAPDCLVVVSGWLERRRRLTGVQAEIKIVVSDRQPGRPALPGGWRRHRGELSTGEVPTADGRSGGLPGLNHPPKTNSSRDV